MENEDKTKASIGRKAADYLLAVFLLFLYFTVTAVYGLKFAALVCISLFTGCIIWLFRLAFQYGKEADGAYKPFSWLLFFLFPLFIPLPLPLWLVPFILTVVYLLTISAFGGYGNHIFNPIILAVVFMLYGYSNTGIIQPSRPLPQNLSGYEIWTAGIPPAANMIEILSDIKLESALVLSMNGSVPNVPGSGFGFWILTASLIYSFLSKGTLRWWLMAVGSICTFASLFPQAKSCEMPPINVLLFGITPSLILSAIADCKSLPTSFAGQAISALLFGAFTVSILLNSDNVLSPAYGFLLAQVLSPLIIDLLEMKI